MTATRWATRRAAVGLLALLPLLLIVGCGKSKGTVKGRVLYKDKTDNTYKLLPGGYVAFIPVEGSGAATTSIDPHDGSYSIENLPVGTMKVTVQSRPNPTGNTSSGGKSTGRPGGSPQKTSKDKSKPPSSAGIPEEVRDKFDLSSDSGKYVPIDKKYQEVATTPLEITVEKGEQTHDIKVD